MSLYQLGKVLVDIGDVVFATEVEDETVLKIRKGHEIQVGGDAGAALWGHLSGGLIDRMPRFRPADTGGDPA